MKNRHERARLRKTKKIAAELDRLAARNLEEIRYDQIDLLTEHIDDLDKVAARIEGFGSLYRKSFGSRPSPDVVSGLAAEEIALLGSPSRKPRRRAARGEREDARHDDRRRMRQHERRQHPQR